MERLTNKKEADAQRLEYENRLKNEYPRNIPEERFLKLASYEDIDLEPEQVTELMAAHGTAILELSEYRQLGPKKHLQELAHAEKDGRMVVLPCKVGAHLWRVTYPYRKEAKVTEFVVKNFRTTGKKHLLQLEVQAVNVPVKNWMYYNDFFLTREEAEAALKKREEGKPG